MQLTKKVPIYPAKIATEKLWSASFLCNKVYNAANEQRRDKKSYGKVNVFTQKRELSIIKKECPEFKKPASQVLQNCIISLDRAYKMFFTKWKKGDKDVRPPKFRSSKYFFTQEYSQRDISFDLSTPGVLKLAYGSGKKDWIVLNIPPGGYENVKTIKMTHDYSNKKWYACMTYEIKEPPLKEKGEILYFDPGCKTALTGIKTTGEFFEYSIGSLRKINFSTYKLIDELKSRRDKKKNRDSQAFRRLTKRINALFSKIKNRSQSYLCSLAKQILAEHSDVKAFKIGDWDKRKTLADTGINFVNRSINRAVQNNNPLMILINILSYKALLRGQEVGKVDERGTTRTCVKCTHIHKDGLSPAERIFIREQCSFTFPRDYHSCLNLLKRFKPALWQRLLGVISSSSTRMELAPFSFKPQRSVNQLITGIAS